MKIHYAENMPLLGTIVNQKLGWGDLMSNHSHAISQSFIFIEKFTRRADASIVKIRDLHLEKCAKSNCRKRNFVYIGVHIRRQDAQRDLVERFKVWRTFYDCLIWMNRNLLNFCVVFFAVTGIESKLLSASHGCVHEEI